MKRHVMRVPYPGGVGDGASEREPRHGVSDRLRTAKVYRMCVLRALTRHGAATAARGS